MSTHRTLTGTHTADGAPNYLQIVTVQLPDETPPPADRYDEERGEMGGYGAGDGARIQVTQRIPHAGEVNRARFMPQNPYLIATRTVQGDVLVFDYTKHALSPAGDECQPDIRLKGHTLEGYGLSWNQLKKGHVISCADDSTICHWDVNAYTPQRRELQPLKVYKGHAGVVGDVAWHSLHDSLFASVGDDCKLMVWDTRSANSSSTGAAQTVQAHAQEVNSVEFNPFYEYVLATASSDKSLRVWDLRQMATPLHQLDGHTDDVLQVQWSPHDQTVLASAGADRRIHVWDLARVGDELSEEDAADGPPELLFIHGGHTSKISDFSWSPSAPWVVGSTAEDNIVQVWQMAQGIYAGANDASSVATARVE